nr:mitogen-activated protein kinase kinase kinase 17-like [Tanacetum cinerariifolium]
MKKRSLTDNENVYEAKRSRYGSVFVANTKVKYSSYPSIMAVKSVEVSVFGFIQKENEVMDNIHRSKNVIKCLGEEITIDNNRIVYNMLLEFASDGTLADVIKKSKGKGLLETDVQHYARSVLKGLSHVHKRGYVHCDLKPDNVLLVANKNNNGFIAKIGDLGSAKRVKQAFGCIVFEMLTGEKLWLAYKDLGKNEVLRRVGYDNEIELVISSSSISNEAKSFLKGCLSKKAVRRLSADKLLDHPFLKGLVDDDVNEVDESQCILDINAITSYSLLSDDDDGDDGYEDELCKSSCSDRSKYVLSPRLDCVTDGRLNEVRIPVRLGISK